MIILKITGLGRPSGDKYQLPFLSTGLVVIITDYRTYQLNDGGYSPISVLIGLAKGDYY